MAVTPAEEVQLNKLYERGLTNGVPDLALLDSEELKRIEPHCRVSVCIHYIILEVYDGGILYYVVLMHMIE